MSHLSSRSGLESRVWSLEGSVHHSSKVKPWKLICQLSTPLPLHGSHNPMGHGWFSISCSLVLSFLSQRLSLQRCFAPPPSFTPPYPSTKSAPTKVISSTILIAHATPPCRAWDSIPHSVSRWPDHGQSRWLSWRAVVNLWIHPHRP